MTRYGACIRKEEDLQKAILENQKQRENFRKNHRILKSSELAELYRIKQLLLSQMYI